MLIESVVLAIIIGYFLRGRLSNLAITPIKGVLFIFGGLIFRNFPGFFVKIYKGGEFVSITNYPETEQILITVQKLAPVLFVLSFVLMMIGVFMNKKHWPMNVVLIGIMLNFVVVTANLGFMPVLKEGLSFAGFDTSKILSSRLDMNHILVDVNTNLTFLSDIIPVPRPYPMPKMLSVGDIFMSVGILLYITTEMAPLEKKFRVRFIKL